MLVSDASTAAEIAATTSGVKKMLLTVPSAGAMSTPERPAMKLASIHELMLTRSAFTPASSVMRELSTTARIRRPSAVERKSTTSAITMTTVIAIVAMSSR